MDDVRLGLTFRAIRLRLGLRQRDVADRAGLSQQAISAIERGRASRLSIDALRRAFAALGATLSLEVRWRGGGLALVLDHGHADLVGGALRHLAGLGWEVRPETTYSIFGERGSIDILAGRPASKTQLVVEVKTKLVSVEATCRKLDEKVRLTRERIGREVLGWAPAEVGALLVLPDASTSRRHVRIHDGVLGVALPDRGWAVSRWLRSPTGGCRGIAFLSVTTGGGTGVGRRRVRSRSGETSRTAILAGPGAIVSSTPVEAQMTGLRGHVLPGVVTDRTSGRWEQPGPDSTLVGGG